ncbi:hypothetical protein B4U80_09651 [Leptotrombidium deliense]|uniref:Uncharacterized protein n=1 Tax=Leptotrombidium deliense TaxID=299467 RepID=A0A443RXG7_9ACAR|nr:hypothetical protein B4U80_09651 [Leptotrombidium deliense]
MYPTVLVYQDGSTITIRYPEPRLIVKLPILLEDLTTDAEKAAYAARRRIREEIKIKEDTTKVKFDGSKYLKFIKK